MELTLSNQPEVCALMKRQCHAGRKLFLNVGMCLPVCMKDVNGLCFFLGLSSSWSDFSIIAPVQQHTAEYQIYYFRHGTILINYIVSGPQSFAFSHFGTKLVELCLPLFTQGKTQDISAFPQMEIQLTEIQVFLPHTIFNSTISYYFLCLPCFLIACTQAQ